MPWSEEKRREYDKKYYQENKEKKKQRVKNYYEANKEKVRQRQKNYHQANKQKINQRAKNYREANKEKLKEYRKNRRQENIEDIRRYNREYRKKRRQQDPAWKLAHNIGCVVRDAIKKEGSSKKGESVLQHLPYTAEQLKEHIESKWAEGMSWQNYGEWHIDHIYPQSKLPYDSMEHPNFLKCWALDNLQPLWAEENRKKSNKVLDKP